MKHIFNNSKTTDALALWAGKDRPLVASCFSWNLGATLQKSHFGLLRSLLHDILEQVPDLILITLPKLFRKASIGEEINPRLSHLIEGITNLSQQKHPLKICLLSMELTNLTAIMPRYPICLRLYRLPTSNALSRAGLYPHVWTFSQVTQTFVCRT